MTNNSLNSYLWLILLQRRDFKDSSGAKPGALFPLTDMWQPLQSEVRALLNDYLTDDERLTAGGRNPISSINDILRDARFSRDRGKVNCLAFLIDLFSNILSFVATSI